MSTATTRSGDRAGGVRAAAAPRRRAARQARPRLPGPLRPLDTDPAAAVPGVGADRPRPVGPRAHRDPLAHDLPRLRDPARPARARSPPAGWRSGRSCAASGSRSTRRCTPSTPSAGRSSTTSRLSESEDPADRQLAIDRRLLEEPRMEAHGVREHPPGTVRGRFIRRALETAVIDVILPAFAGQLLGAATAGTPADPRHGRPRERVPAGAHPLRHPRTRRPRPRPRRLEAGARRTGPRSARRAVRQGHLDRRRRPRHARPRRPRLPRDHRPPRPATSRRTVDRPGPGRRRRHHGTGRRREQQRRRTLTVGGLARRGAPAGARSRRPRVSSSSWTRTSTCSRSSNRPPAATAAPRPEAAGAAPDCRPAGCPTAASTGRPRPTRSSTPAVTPPGCARRSPTAPAASTSAHREDGSTGAPTPAHTRSARPASR